MEQQFFAWLQTKLVIIFGLTVLVFMIVEFVILSTVGTTGPDLSATRQEREQVKLENEIKQAEIRQYQTNDRIVASVEGDLEMRGQAIINLQPLPVFDDSVTAGSN